MEISSTVNINIIQELIKYLVANAIGHSIDDPDQFKNSADIVLKSEYANTYEEKHSDARNILIIGAGVSHNASNNIPLARDFAKKLRDKIHGLFNTKIGKLTNPIDAQLDYLSRAYNLQNEEFETIMLACSRISNELVFQELKDKYDIKHVPNLFFEIVGHLFKHRFIDVIINFNFDEILDSVIEDEMSGMNYHSIVSDGDLSVEIEDLMTGHRLKEPIYIKPHGTISHPSSIRSNKEHYYSLPANIGNLIKHLFIAKYYDSSLCEKFLQLNLIVAGYSMQSNDLNYLLIESIKERERKNLPYPKPNLFVFDLDKDRYLDVFKRTTLYETVFNKINESEWFNFHHTNKNGKTKTDYGSHEGTSLECLFYNLFNSCLNQFNQTIMPRGIERHLIISEIFENEQKTQYLRIFTSNDSLQPENKIRSIKYLQARIYVELAILMVQADGLINILQIKESRVGKYLNLLKNIKLIIDKEQHSDVRENICIDIDTYVKEFNFESYKGFSKDTFYKNVTNECGYVNEIVDCLFEKLNQINDPEHIHINNTELIKQHFINLSKKPAWLIKPNFNEHTVTKFKSVTDQSFLHTDLRFRLVRFFLFKKNGSSSDHINIVLSITKRASFLTDEPWIKDRFHNNYKMFLILADFGNHNSINKQNTNIIIRRLKWWLHNQHVHLFIGIKNNFFSELGHIDSSQNSDSKNWEDLNRRLNDLLILKGGIYYQRRMLSRLANPILLKGCSNSVNSKVDLVELLDIFISYWARSEQPDQKNKNNSIEDLGHFVEAKINLFKLFINNIEAN